MYSIQRITWYITNIPSTNDNVLQVFVNNMREYYYSQYDKGEENLLIEERIIELMET